MEQYEQHGPGLFGDKTPLWFWVDHYQEAEARTTEFLRNFARKVRRDYFIAQMRPHALGLDSVQRVLDYLDRAQ